MGDSLSQPTPHLDLVDDDPNQRFLPLCPVCGGPTQPMNEVRPASMFACAECETAIFVPPAAWSTARAKRMGKWLTKP